jgi:hypothetical protein
VDGDRPDRHRGRLVVGGAGAKRTCSGNPWAIAGYSQVDAPTMLQAADLAGVLGVGSS